MLLLQLRRWLQPLAAVHGQTRTPDVSRWSTSSFGTAADTSPLELFDLSEHLERCRRLRGPLFPALCLSDTVNRFLAPRLVTALLVVALSSLVLSTL
jgi:hypothetical protein